MSVTDASNVGRALMPAVALVTEIAVVSTLQSDLILYNA
jgi:hypothetical protein